MHVILTPSIIKLGHFREAWDSLGTLICGSKLITINIRSCKNKLIVVESAKIYQGWETVLS